ncbi:MAG TPA: lysine-2,3-aminomutase-like protein [Alphaproteobacteria bacterium]|nr:lysine-2,3-aminomutase-like protein [Alphaproteobacteria bacterium]USO06747.1 MAG: lysine-2,3-aminomutase-like protein [Rhodospirillales bacterium]HOO81241.1 lysine-2,3-aminomutase-like protein [Alphaproteobacteria bacterium]
MCYIKLKGGDIDTALLKKYAYRITQNIKHAIKGDITNDPIAKQYLPQACELKVLPEERSDPIGDEAHSPVKGIIHRYPDRVLFKPANVCAVYCRYCFRREQVGPKDKKIPGSLNPKEYTAALDYIRSHPKIWEVILTGGDPLVLSPRHLGEIMNALRAIDHVKVIRIHTRVPIADPARLTPALIDALASSPISPLIKANKEKTDRSVCYPDKALYMALHINHAQELTPEVRRTIKTLHQRGISLLSQSVMLKGINNDAATLANLYRELITLHVKPYYLHHPDLAPGTSHFRLSIKEGQSIIRALRGHLSGLCQPTYMLDIPGGYGKVPLTPCALEPLPAGGYNVTDYKGGQHIYAPQSES